MKLRNLTHFYTRVLNAPMKCTEDRLKIDSLLKDVRTIMKFELEELQGDQ